MTEHTHTHTHTHTFSFVHSTDTYLLNIYIPGCHAKLMGTVERGGTNPPPLAFKKLNSVLGVMNLLKTQVQENMIIALTGVGTRCYCA